jgi:hypothetical protein
MGRHLLALALALLPLACGGGVDLSNAMGYCDESQSILCDKVFACIPTSAQDQAFKDAFGSSPSDCKTSMVVATCANAAARCATYDAKAAQQCIDALDALTCGDLGSGNATPAACGAACKP